MIHAVGINLEQNNQENNKLFFGKLEGSRITKRVFWVWFSDKGKKGGNSAVWKGWHKAKAYGLSYLVSPPFFAFLAKTYPKPPFGIP